MSLFEYIDKEVWDAEGEIFKTMSPDEGNSNDHEDFEGAKIEINDLNSNLPEDYDEVVNTGIKSAVDAMDHWKIKLHL